MPALRYPILLLIFLDGTLTILGQEKSYFEQNTAANEANPLGAFWMSQSSSILWLYLGLSIYMFLVWLILKYTKDLINNILTFSFYSGHLVACGLWLSVTYKKNGLDNPALYFWLFITFVVFVSLFTSYFIQHLKEKELQTQEIAIND
jgi:hypothetical protein